MWKMKKSKTFVTLMAAACLMLTGCGGGTSKYTSQPDTKEETVAEERDKDGKLHLTFYFPVQVGGDAAKLVEEICNDFSKENSEIVVDPIYTGNYDDTVTKIQTAIQGGTPPDVFVSLANQRYTMATTGMAMPLDELIAEDGEEGKQYIEDFLGGFMKDSYVEGKIYSIPFQRSTMIMYYNKDLFKKAGLDPEQPPKTWDEMIEMATKLTNKDQKGIGIALNSGSAQWGFTGLALQNSENGENLATEDGKKALFYTKGNVEALQMIVDLQKKYKCMQDGIVQWTDLPTQFLGGQVAMMWHTTGNLKNIKDNADFEFGTAFLPGNKRQAAPTGGGNLYITAGISKERQKAAWEFIKFATSKEQATKWSLNTGYVATRNSCYEMEEMKKYYEDFPQAKVGYEQIAISDCELTTYDAAEIWRIFNDHVQAAVTGEQTPEEALKEVQEMADEILADYE